MLCHTSPPPKPQPHLHNRCHNEMRIALSLLRPAALLTSSIRPLPLIRKTKTLTTPNPSSVRLPLHLLRFTTMASAYKPEAARVPPAVELSTPPITKFKIALCQLSVTTDKPRNILHARKAIEEAAGKGAQLIVLPEIWNSPYLADSFPVYAEDIEAGGDAAPSFSMLSDAARQLKVTIVGGSIPERCGDCLYNTCCVFGTDGQLMGKHRKVFKFVQFGGLFLFKITG